MKIAIYARVSTELQEVEKTIESQLNELEPLIREHQHVVIDRYIDDGYSGTILARPGLDRLRDDATKGLFEAVLAYDPDRLARKYAYQVLVIEELKSRGVETIFKEMQVVKTPEDQLLLDVRGVVAEYERAKILERTRRGRLHRAKSNHIIGNIPPYGYSCVSKAQSSTGYAYYKINEVEAKNVRLVFDFLANRQMTTYGIIRELNRMGIKPRIGVRWARSTINKIARNETYIGTTYYNKHYGIPSKNQTGNNGEVIYRRRKNSSTRLRDKGEWIAINNVPAILDKETFEQAQKQLEMNFKMADRNTKFQYLLKGLLKCGKDNKSIYGIPVHGKQYYRCSNKSKLNSDTGCSTPSISAGLLDPLVWNSVKDLLNNPKLILEQYKKRQLNKRRDILGTENKLKVIEADLLKLKNEENRILLAYSQEALSLDQFKDQNLRITDERKKLEQSRAELQQLSSTVMPTVNLKSADINRLVKDFRKTLEGLDFEKKRTILRGVLNEIELRDRKVYMRGILPMNSNVILRTQPPHERTTRSRKDAPVTRLYLNSSRAQSR